MTAVTEAYTLMDHGQTGRAIELLEQVVQQEPGNEEARLMLASAYMGKAGIDVLSLHDAFQDVLFSHSLSDVFLSGDKGAAKDPVKGADLPAAQQSKDDTPVERVFQNVDEFLNNVRRVMLIFNRFPHVDESKWPLLDQALWNLDQIKPAKQVRVYRLFIRMVYFKEFLVVKVIKDPSFGTRSWACQIETEALKEHLLWMMTTLARASEDFIYIYPKEGSPFIRASAIFKTFEDELERLDHDAPVGGETGMMIGQRRLREALRCGTAH